jgi:hypothetical protein
LLSDHNSSEGREAPKEQQVKDVKMPLVMRFLMPSITDAIFILLLFAMTAGVLAPRLLRDADIGWHIRNGQLILQTHAITRADPFSSSMRGQPWYSWEWLYDAGIAVAYNWAGLNAVVLISAIVIAFTFALLFRLTLARGSNVVIAVLLILLTLAATAIHLFARPHIFSWLLLIVWFQILDSSEPIGASSSSLTFKKHHLFSLPLIMLFWVNIHGEFVLGFVLLGIYIFSGVVRFFFQAEQRAEILAWLRRVGAITVVSFILTFVNPYGYKLHIHIYRYLSDRWLIDHIEEFQSPNFHGWAQQSFVLLVLITIAVLAFAREKLRLSHLLVLLFAVHSGFYAARNLPTSCMLMTLLIAPLIPALPVSVSSASTSVASGFLKRCRVFAARMTAMESHLRRRIWPVAAVVCWVIVCAHGGRLMGTQIMDAHFDAKRFPVESAAFIAGQHIAGPIFAPDAWGGYLIYRLAPETKVFVDDRHDLYGKTFLKDYIKVVSVSPVWESVLDHQYLQWVLAPNGSSLGNILKQTPRWRLVHEDGTAVLFERD